MTNFYNLRVQDCEAVASLLDLFVFSEQKWCTWEKLEESIAKVDYEKLSEKELNWFVEFMANCCERIWRTSKGNEELNIVKEDDICFFIHNYDWNAYKFAVQKGTNQETTTKNVLCVDKEKLTEQEIKWLRSKCK